MVSLPVSGTFVGRAADLANLDAARRDPAVTAVLITAAAGMGKSRLVREFGDRLPTGTLVATGRCPEFGNDAVPFGPFVPALRELLRTVGVGGLREVLPAPTPALARWLPELTGTGSAAGDPDRTRLFGEVLTVLEQLSQTRPLVLVLEDLHWADASSLDLLAFLVANLDRAEVLIVGTHRPVGTGRLRELTAELRRLPSVLRIEPHPLTRYEVGRLLAALLGREPEPGRTARIFERSGGSPLFVEALSRAADDSPAELTELLLAGLAGLSADAVTTLRAAAVAGSPVEHELLAVAADLPEERLDAAIAESADARLLLPRETGYEFRHLLIRDAVYQDQLPAKRMRTHARLAAALRADADLLPRESRSAELAEHAYAARDWPVALSASWEAAGVAADAGADPERLRHLERVLDLWDRAPRVATALPVDRAALLESIAEICARRGAVDRGLALVDEALGMADQAPDLGSEAAHRLANQSALVVVSPTTRNPDVGSTAAADRRHSPSGTLNAVVAPRVDAADARPGETRSARLGRLLLIRARLGNQAGGGLADLRRALAVLPEEPSEVRGQALVELASVQMFTGDAAGAARSARAAVAVAEQVPGSAALAARAYTFLGLASADEIDFAATYFRTARELAPDPAALLTVSIWESAVQVAAGEYDTAIAVVRQGLRAAHDSFRFVEKGPILIVKQVQALTALGRWTEAADLIEETLADRIPPIARAALLLCHARIAVARGDTDSARTAADDAEALLGSHDWAVQYRLELAAIRIRCTDDGIDELLTAALAGIDPAAHPHEVWPLLTVTADRTPADVDPLALPCRTRPDIAYRLTREAARTGDADDWQAAARAWQELWRPFEQAEALTEAARALPARGDRAAAATALRTAHTIGTDLAAEPLLRTICDIARRSGVQLGDEAPAARPAPRKGSEFGLTARELDVLRLIAAGLSNRRIGAELFISGNTAGVHVSRILAKLGAATRTEAAALARAHGLLSGGDELGA
ncbi:helix-turn-helix transcriptional regulator [Nocardia sp. alder85J]|uniref:helix-turn-helix transcriptional regulator n=1 Tax=Nocardia sp. alder85J TaxID=2862949 RepID=UPI002B1CC50B|nr:AAA family ATPase [Nocardia sp. alder85J]